jgi:hypothetical protein
MLFYREFRNKKYKEHRGIPLNFADFESQSLQYLRYEFEYFKCKFARIDFKISGLAEVESASFFLVH